MLGPQSSSPGAVGAASSTGLGVLGQLGSPEAPEAPGRVTKVPEHTASGPALSREAAESQKNQAPALGRPWRSSLFNVQQWASRRQDGKTSKRHSSCLLHLAPQGGQKVSLKVTGNRLELSPIEESDHKGYYQLFAAAVGDVEWLRFCLDQHCGDIQTNDKGFAAIHMAAQKGQLTCLKVLVEEYKFPVDLPTLDGETALHLVIHKDNKAVALQCIHYLLEKGASLHAQTHSGSTPLHLAASEGLLSCVQTLVQRGANVHAQDSTGYKPIDYCKMWNHRPCARFLKDAMWKRDKDDFAHEMGKLKRLKNQLDLMKLDYLAEYQKEHKVLKEMDFRKWLHCRLFNHRHSLLSKTKQMTGTPTRAIVLPKTSKWQGPQTPQGCQPRVKLQLRSIQPCTGQVPSKPIYQQPSFKRPKLWNPSNNPARSPSTQFSYPQGVRLGIQPDSCQKQDFSSFLDVIPGPNGCTWLHRADGHWVAPVPQLPLEVIIRELYPQSQPCRMQVPQGFHAVNIKDVPHKRHSDSLAFYNDTLAMSLRQTFDEAFLANVRAHQGLPALPAPTTPP